MDQKLNNNQTKIQYQSESRLEQKQNNATLKNFNLTCRLITNWNDFEQLKSQWDPLLQQSDADTLFLTWDWINCWRETAPFSITPYILVLEQDNVLIAIAPFYLQTYSLFRIFSLNALRILADQGIGSEYSNFIVKNNNSDIYKLLLWKELQSKKHSENWDFIWFINIATWKAGGRNLTESLFLQSKLHCQQRNVSFGATPLNQFNHNVNKKNNNQANILAKLSKSLRTNIKQTTKRLSKIAVINFRNCEQETLNQDLNNLFKLHNRRWQETGIIGSFAKRPHLKHFYQSFAPIALANQQLQLLTLEHDGTSKAVQYGYIYNKTFLAIQEGFDPSSEKGIGQVLRLHAFEQCLLDDIFEYDFLGEYTDHKRRWLAKRRTGKNILIYSNKLKNMLFYFGKIWPTGRYLTPVSEPKI